MPNEDRMVNHFLVNTHTEKKFFKVKETNFFHSHEDRASLSVLGTL